MSRTATRALEREVHEAPAADQRPRTRLPTGTVPSLLAILVVTIAIAAFTGIAWQSELVRRALARLGPSVPALVYLAALVALGVSLWPRARRMLTARLRSELALPLGLLAGAVAYVTVVFSTWERGRGSNAMLGGVVPWADASLYLGGAERLLFFGRLDDVNAHRPLNTMFLAVKLAVTNLDMRVAVLLQAVLLAVACVLAARAVARTLGTAAGIVFFAGLFAFSYFYAATTLTETLGLTFGVLAFAAMWTAVRSRSVCLAVSGVGLLAVALDIRSGALLLLVVLPLWFAYRWRGERRLNWRVLFAALAAAAAGTALNYIAVLGLGGQVSNVNGNAGFLYYGMARGHPGWDLRTNPTNPSWVQVLKDYPQVLRMSEPERNRFVNRKARQEILAHPVRFGGAALRSGKNYLVMAWDDAFAVVHRSWLRWSIAGFFALVGSMFLVARWRSSARRVLLDVVLFAGVVIAIPVLVDMWFPRGHGQGLVGAALAAAGFAAFVVVGTERLHVPDHLSFSVTALVALAASIPLLGIDSVRVFAATVPFFAVVVALGVAVLERGPTPRPRRQQTAAGVAGPADRSAGAWWPVWLGGALLVATLAGTPIAMAAVDRPPMPARTCPDGRRAQPLIGGVGVQLVGDAPGAKHGVDQLHIGDFHRNTLFFVPFATGPLSDIHQGQTLLTGLTRRGDDRMALVEGAVSAPQASTSYLCGATVHDPPADGWLSVYPAPFDFFYGRPLGAR